MIRKYILFTLLLLGSLFSQAAQLNQEAEKAYLGENYYKALDLYTQLGKNEGVSSELYYNIGNCYYRLKNIGKAVVYYERALNLNPSNEKARINLDFITSKIVNRTDIDERNIISQIFNNAENLMTSNAWAITSVVIFLLLLGAIALYIFTASVTTKKIGFFGGIILLICNIVSFCCASSLRDRAKENNYAVVTSQSATISKAPRAAINKSDEILQVNEGNKLMILDSIDITVGKKVEHWYNVQADDSNQGWVNKSNLETI